MLASNERMISISDGLVPGSGLFAMKAAMAATAKAMLRKMRMEFFTVRPPVH
jgi:hypothetical protein